MIGTGRWISIDSQEYKDLMDKWSRDAYREEMQVAKEEYESNEDMHGRLDQ